MIPAKSIIDKTNQYIGNTSITDLQFTQLSAVDNFLANSSLTVTTTPELPKAADYVGVTVYVSGEQQYYFSDGIYWRKEFASDYEVINQTPYGWGRNSFGQVGDNTTSSWSSPVAVTGGITSWSKITSGTLHVLAIANNGVLYAWGYNGGGRLGDNTTSQRSSPVTVVGGITNWNLISAGGLASSFSGGHSLACTANGVLYAWGRNANGQLGTNNITSYSSPVTVVGGITNWIQLSAGGNHNLGLTSTGLAYAWGRNYNGELGDSTNIDRSSPVPIPGLWKQVSAGYRHSIAIDTSGVAYTWGMGNWGQLGNGSQASSRSSPGPVLGNLRWVHVAASSAQISASGSCFGITTSGVLYAWGNNNYGRLGTNNTTAYSSPVTVVGGITNWIQISAAAEHTLGLTGTGILYAWGGNLLGYLGDNTTSSRLSPVIVAGGITNWSQIASGRYGSTALSTSTLVTKGFV